MPITPFVGHSLRGDGAGSLTSAFVQIHSKCSRSLCGLSSRQLFSVPFVHRGYGTPLKEQGFGHVSTFLRYCCGIVLTCVVVGWWMPRGDEKRQTRQPKLLSAQARMATPLADEADASRRATANSSSAAANSAALPRQFPDPNIQLATLLQDDQHTFTDVKLSFKPTTDGDAVRDVPVTSPSLVYRINPDGVVTVTAQIAAPGDLSFFLETDGRLKIPGTVSDSQVTFKLPALRDGEHTVTLRAEKEKAESDTQVPLPFSFMLKTRTRPVAVRVVDASSLAYDVTPYTIRVTFNTDELDDKTVVPGSFSLLKKAADADAKKESIPSSKATIIGSSVEVEFNNRLSPGAYILEITGIKDKYGNTLATNVEKEDGKKAYQWMVYKPAGSEPPSVRPGITGSTAPYTSYPEFTKPRKVPSGFNPGDKVETRVARLYYFRDAHRVAQIINRRVRSYNRVGVDVQRQLADRARNLADQATLARRHAERAAAEKARQTRLAETELAAAQQALDRTLQVLAEVQRSSDENKEDTVTQLKAAVKSFRAKIESARARVETLRDEEAAANEMARQLNQRESLAREEQFRREVAAAHADPDTHAPGVPDSDDPVEQVSVSVIGEGLIHLRGPLKGINIIRNMIDQIDAPVGQVRIGVHTIQINGERADRMEVVAARIQRYIDQARFLSMQSSELLRRAIVEVASEVAQENQQFVGDMPMPTLPGESQDDRDARYLYAFFGKDFTDELRALDSEFLHTGNKLLSLHSLDTTSLSSALTLMALAKNSVRQQILDRFEELTQTELPRAEESYLQSGMCACGKKHGRIHKKGHILLADNARFESLKGFFRTQIGQPDAMTPLQREFIRLAQIFKARLITEMEYKQRVMERALIERRGGNLLDADEHQVEIEMEAKENVEKAERAISGARTHAKTLIETIIATRKYWDSKFQGISSTSSPKDVDEIVALAETLGAQAFVLPQDNNGEPKVETLIEKKGELDDLSSEIEKRAKLLLLELDGQMLDAARIYGAWYGLRQYLKRAKQYDPQMSEKALQKGDTIFEGLVEDIASAEAARKVAELSRRPLDHKKFLDMLIDELEEKYIELRDGTRAHTANIDNYLKRLTTALDDDFNTQFYYPAFRCIREASTYWDVQFGQTETTTILANNRAFAKVVPEATMEFDLPKRDILLTEGINGAKALINDVGALANDPTFLAAAKMFSGGSTASPAAGSTRGFGVVRNVLPGLDGSTTEEVLAQNANGGPQFGSNLENLIPDPAIYKFETGTGFEIRPVIQPDGQAVVFDFNYMYTTELREPVRADEKHLGRVKRHFIDTDVQLSNFELREVSRYIVVLKAARTSRGVPLLEDIPVAGVLFRPLPSDESSLQENLIYAQATIFPTLFDLMGLRWAPAVAELDPLEMSNRQFIVRGRHRMIENQVYDFSSSKVDEFLRIPDGNRRPDLYRTQQTVPRVHPNGYQGPGLDLNDSRMQEGYRPGQMRRNPGYVPAKRSEGRIIRPDGR